MLTSQNFGLLTDVYTELPGGSGLQVGMVQQVPNTNNFKMLVQNNPEGATLADGALLSFLSGSADDYIVRAADTDTDAQPGVGVQDNAGGTVTVGQYFWMSIRGFADLLIADGIAVGALVGPSSAAGVAGAISTTQQGNISAQVANSSGLAAIRQVYIQ